MDPDELIDEEFDENIDYNDLDFDFERDREIQYENEEAEDS